MLPYTGPEYSCSTRRLDTGSFYYTRKHRQGREREKHWPRSVPQECFQLSAAWTVTPTDTERCCMRDILHLGKEDYLNEFNLFIFYHVSTLFLSLGGGRILSGRSRWRSAMCAALLLRCLSSNPLNATAPSVARCSIICTAVKVSGDNLADIQHLFCFIHIGAVQSGRNSLISQLWFVQYRRKNIFIYKT